MTDAPLRCVTCDAPLSGPFCANCGEKRIAADDLSFKHFFEHALEAFTHLDGKVFATVRALVGTPGQLTADYFRGRRKPYLAPLHLFLVINLLCFLLMPLLHWNTFTTPLYTHMNQQPYSLKATAAVQAKLQASGESLDAYSARFDHSASIAARSLLILLVPLFSVPVALLYWRRRYLESVIYSMHFCAALILIMIAVMGAFDIAVLLLRPFHVRIPPEVLDLGSGFADMLVSVVYLHRSLGRTFPGPQWLTGVRALVLALLLFPVIQLYRSALFLVAFWST